MEPDVGPVPSREPSVRDNAPVDLATACGKCGSMHEGTAPCVTVAGSARIDQTHEEESARRAASMEVDDAAVHPVEEADPLRMNPPIPKLVFNITNNFNGAIKNFVIHQA